MHLYYNNIRLTRLITELEFQKKQLRITYAVYGISSDPSIVLAINALTRAIDTFTSIHETFVQTTVANFGLVNIVSRTLQTYGINIGNVIID